MMTSAISAMQAGMGAAATATPVQPLNLYHGIDGVTGRPATAFEELFFRSGGATDAAQAVDGLYMLIFWYSAAFFVLLMFLMVYWVIKYRRRPGVPAPVSPSHNTLLEIVWTVVPSSALLVIFFLGFWNYIDRQVAHGDAYELAIKAKKWSWTPVYHNGASTQWFLPTDETVDPVTGDVTKTIVDSPVIVVPEDSNIRLTMSSTDVIHSFWIPDLRIKGDVFPNRYTGYTFRTPKLEPGQPYQDHWVFCAEYCGDQHGAMAAVLRVMPSADFDQTVSGWSGALTGDKVAQVQGCFTCHSVDGTNMAGPTWLGLYGSSGTFDNAPPIDFKDENYIRESILNPNAKLVSGRAGMTSYDGLLSEAELDALVFYIRGLSDAGQKVNEELEAGGDGGEASDAETGDGESDEASGTEAAGDDAPSDAGDGESDEPADENG